MTAQLDAYVAALDLPDDCDPDNRAFRRALLIELRRGAIVRRGVPLRRREAKR